MGRALIPALHGVRHPWNVVWNIGAAWLKGLPILVSMGLLRWRASPGPCSLCVVLPFDFILMGIWKFREPI